MSTTETLTTTAPGPHESSVEPLNERGSAVRFETQCVVIPDHVYRSPRRPRVVTKSYALPLWRRRSSSAGPSSAPRRGHPSPEESQSHLVLRVALPTLSLKSPPSARSAEHPPLPPCLVHRPQPPGSDPASSPTQTRSPRSARKAFHSPSSADIITIPLRPCCAACQPVTEAALVDGDAWQEHFSRAASRRRSMSADNGPRTITVAGSAASSSYGTLGVSINVDEVDKRRRSSDGGSSMIRGQTMPWSDDAKAREEGKVPLTARRSTTANSASTDEHVSPPPTRLMPAAPRIPEEDGHEDENELFPLPSPKRTPTSSPVPSPVGSMSSLMVVHGSQNCSTCSGDSPNPFHANKRRDLLAPPSCPSSSSLSLPRLCDSTANLSEDSNCAPPSPSVLFPLPSISNRHRSRSPSPLSALDQSCPADTASLTTKDAPSETCPLLEPALPSIATPSEREALESPSLVNLHYSPLSSRLPWRSKRSVSADACSATGSPPSSFSFSTSPTQSFSSPSVKKTFGVANPRHVIAEVLRGVGTVASSGMGI